MALVATLLSACEGMPVREAEAPAPPPAQLPFAEPQDAPHELDAELVYSYLTGEVAAQRGELGLAFRHYMHAATLAKDPYAAERATRIAVYLGDLDSALIAARRWVELAPNGLNARMTLALLVERHGDRAAALAELEALLKVSAALGQDGFLQIASVLVKEDAAGLLPLMEQLVDDHLDDARAHYALAVVRVAAKSYEAAEQSLLAALRLRPDWVEPQVLLARSRHARGETAQAIDGLGKALARNAKSELLRTTRARLLVDAGDHEGALKDFRRLRKQAPDDADYLYAVGMLAMQGEHWDEARGAWQQLRNQGGDRYDEASYFLAQVEEQEGNLAVAAGLYASVGEGELLMDAGLRLAGIEARQGQLDAARERLRQLRISVPDRAVDAYLAEARLLRQAGRGQDAGEVLSAAVEAQPDNIELRYGRAMHAARMGDIALLERDLRYILTLEPQHVDALNALGYTLADRTDRYAEAYDYISRAYRLEPENAAILDSLGWVYYRLGNHEQALRYLRQALEMQHDPEIAAHLYEVLWVTGNRQEAGAVWRKAIAAFPDSPELREARQRLQ
jgi:tetratricopeptide (TPR) repeat protein